jgi:hypothetical protein
MARDQDIGGDVEALCGLLWPAGESDGIGEALADAMGDPLPDGVLDLAAARARATSSNDGAVCF